jgi:hypothetical protein
MKETSRKRIRNAVEGALEMVLKSLRILKPSKKTRGVIKKVSKKYSEQLRIEIKRQGKMGALKRRPTRKATRSSSAKDKKP